MSYILKLLIAGYQVEFSCELVPEIEGFMARIKEDCWWVFRENVFDKGLDKNCDENLFDFLLFFSFLEHNIWGWRYGPSFTAASQHPPASLLPPASQLPPASLLPPAILFPPASLPTSSLATEGAHGLPQNTRDTAHTQPYWLKQLQQIFHDEIINKYSERSWQVLSVLSAQISRLGWHPFLIIFIWWVSSDSRIVQLHFTACRYGSQLWSVSFGSQLCALPFESQLCAVPCHKSVLCCSQLGSVPCDSQLGSVPCGSQLCSVPCDKTVLCCSQSGSVLCDSQFRSVPSGLWKPAVLSSLWKLVVLSTL